MHKSKILIFSLFFFQIKGKSLKKSTTILVILEFRKFHLTMMKKKRNFERKRGGEGGYIDVVTNGIELAGGFLVEPIGSDLVEYLIHFDQQR